MATLQDFQKVIGLEIHVRIKSKEKMFCRDANSLALTAEPNSDVSAVSMGFPGMLPVLNPEVVKLGLI